MEGAILSILETEENYLITLTCLLLLRILLKKTKTKQTKKTKTKHLILSGEMLEVLPLKIETRMTSVSTFVHNKERLKKKKMKSESIGKKTNNEQKKKPCHYLQII